MFGLPVWAVQLIITLLKASGLTGWAGATSLQLIDAVERKLKNVKTYHEKSDFPNSSASSAEKR